MQFFETLANIWSRLLEKLVPILKKIGHVFSKIGHVLKIVWTYIFRFRKLILAIPVIGAAGYLASVNMKKLPQIVGLQLHTDGTFTLQVVREVAVVAPLAVTSLCVLLMFCSRRTLTPWFVSLVSLILPLLILVLNTFPM